MMQFSVEILDSFAPRLSELCDCTLPEVAELPSYRSALIINRILFGGGWKDELRIPISNFLVRLQYAIIEYRQASHHLQIYLAALPDHGKLGSHTRAVAHFENCILRTHLAATMLNAVGARLGTISLWTKGDRSIFSRINEISNRIKHFDNDIKYASEGQAPLPLAPIWLTNQGLECAPCNLSFEELAYILRDMAGDAENFGEKWLAAAAAEKHGGALGSATQPASSAGANQPPQAPATGSPS